MADDEKQEVITEELIVEQLKSHFGEWVIKPCMHRGEPGILLKVHTGQVFCVAVHEVRGIIVT